MTRPDQLENSKFEKIGIFRNRTAFFLRGWLLVKGPKSTQKPRKKAYIYDFYMR